MINDNCHAIGASYRGDPGYAAKYADLVTHSYHAVKNITTGEGGAITFKIFDEAQDALLLKELRLLSLNGQNKTAFQKNSIGGWKYDITTNGLKVNMPDINAAIGLAQIKNYKNTLLPEREKIFLKYNSILSQYTWAILPTFSTDSRQSSCHLYQLRIKGFEEKQRDELMNMLASVDIGVNVHYIPLPMLSYFKSIGLDIGDFPSSYNLYKNEISLPIYNNLSEESVEYVCERLIEFVKKVNK